MGVVNRFGKNCDYFGGDGFEIAKIKAKTYSRSQEVKKSMNKGIYRISNGENSNFLGEGNKKFKHKKRKNNDIINCFEMCCGDLDSLDYDY